MVRIKGATAMATRNARNAESYVNEAATLAMVPALLYSKGFVSAETDKHGSMKFARARRQDGQTVHFWLKQGWPGEHFSAIQFGLFDGRVSDEISDQEFLDVVTERIASAQAKGGATHALIVRTWHGELTNYIALTLDDVVAAYREQLSKWPKRARNSKSPTLYFEDSRAGDGARCVSQTVKKSPMKWSGEPSRPHLECWSVNDMDGGALFPVASSKRFLMQLICPPRIGGFTMRPQTGYCFERTCIVCWTGN
jgi:hypothetical protein